MDDGTAEAQIQDAYVSGKLHEGMAQLNNRAVNKFDINRILF